MNDTSTQTWLGACATTLASLPGINPSQLSNLLSDRSPDVAWQMLVEGDPGLAASFDARSWPARQSTWQRWAREIDPIDVLETYARSGVSVFTHYTSYPARLIDDPHSPAVLFMRGNMAAFERPTVAIIGTRQCSNEGRMIAHGFGRQLSERGVSVVSGLALGIDGAAHRGAFEAAWPTPPMAVVGSGLDVVYPRANKELWHRVGTDGALLSETALGMRPERWRFPARNRIIAGLSDVVVVVESHETGGSLITAVQAAEAGVPVMAVPGSIQKPACTGTNRLLADGCAPACSVDDIIDVLGDSVLSTVRSAPPKQFVDIAELPADQRTVLEAIDWEPTSVNDVMVRTSLAVGPVARHLEQLAQLGLVIGEGGWWRRLGEARPA